MIHTIIYDNRPERGYDFYEQTSNFPSDYKQDIMEFCKRLEQPNGGETREPALRYAPLRDRYLLSVILCQSAREVQTRSHVTVVNFLMTAEAADESFTIPFTQMAAQALQVTKELLSYRDQALPWIKSLREGQPDTSQPCAGAVPPALLLSGALYSAKKQPIQLFIGCDSLVIPELSALIHMLPYKLRKDISFRTDIRYGAESYNTAINFGTLRSIDDLVSRDYPGSQNTNKYCCFVGAERDLLLKSVIDETTNSLSGQLFRAITAIAPYEIFRRAIQNWEEFASLVDVNGTPDPLKTAITLVPEANLAEVIIKSDLAPSTLQLLEQATPKKCHEVIKAIKSKLPTRKAPPAQQPVIIPHPGSAGQPESPKPTRRIKPKRTLSKKTIRIITDLLLIVASGWGLIGLLDHTVNTSLIDLESQLILSISLAATVNTLKLIGATALGTCLGIFLLRLFENMKK